MCLHRALGVEVKTLDEHQLCNCTLVSQACLFSSPKNELSPLIRCNFTHSFCMWAAFEWFPLEKTKPNDAVDCAQEPLVVFSKLVKTPLIPFFTGTVGEMVNFEMVSFCTCAGTKGNQKANEVR